MKVLMVSPHLPSPTSGNRSRSYYLLKMLARQHTVSLLTWEDGVVVEAPQDMPPLESFTQSIEAIHNSSASGSKRVRQLANVIRGKSKFIDEHGVQDMQNTLDLLYARDRYDAIVFESALTSGYRLPRHVRVVLDQHNIEYEFFQRASQSELDWLRKWYYRREYQIVKSVEIKLCRDAHAIAVTSERERLLLKSMVPEGIIEVVPNGVDIDYFNGSDPGQEAENRIVFTGSMEYYPNIKAALFFARKCWPLIRKHIPDASWQIVGKNPLPDVQKLAKLPGITVTGTVVDVRPYFAQAKLAIVPLQVGGGTRLKILEAMAMRKAVISTSLGCEGLAIVPGMHLIVEDEPEAFAQAVIELLNSPEKRLSLGTAGRELVEAEYSWERCGDQLLHMLELLHETEPDHFSSPRLF
jgi:polysaccharide biosynthesis protein PslH